MKKIIDINIDIDFHKGDIYDRFKQDGDIFDEYDILFANQMLMNLMSSPDNEKINNERNIWEVIIKTMHAYNSLSIDSESARESVNELYYSLTIYRNTNIKPICELYNHMTLIFKNNDGNYTISSKSFNDVYSNWKLFEQFVRKLTYYSRQFENYLSKDQVNEYYEKILDHHCELHAYGELEYLDKFLARVIPKQSIPVKIIDPFISKTNGETLVRICELKPIRLTRNDRAYVVDSLYSNNNYYIKIIGILLHVLLTLESIFIKKNTENDALKNCTFSLFDIAGVLFSIGYYKDAYISDIFKEIIKLLQSVDDISDIDICKIISMCKLNIYKVLPKLIQFKSHEIRNDINNKKFEKSWLKGQKYNVKKRYGDLFKPTTL